MKNPKQERYRRLMRQYHRSRPWRLDNGLFIPHAYPVQHQLSWWDDMGFVLNGRRVMVWWVHPRMRYADAISDLAWQEAGEPPCLDGDIFGRHAGKKIWKKAGRSRKKVVAYEASPIPEARREYYEKLRTVEARLESEGIDFEVPPSMSVKSYSWCSGVSLCVPLEVRDKEELLALAHLAKRLLKGETTLDDEFSGGLYGRNDWLSEADFRKRDGQRDETTG